MNNENEYIKEMLNKIGIEPVHIHISDIPEHLREEFMSGNLSKEAEDFLVKYNKAAKEKVENEIDFNMAVAGTVKGIEMILEMTNGLEYVFYEPREKEKLLMLYNKCAEVCRKYNALDIGE